MNEDLFDDFIKTPEVPKIRDQRVKHERGCDICTKPSAVVVRLCHNCYKIDEVEILKIKRRIIKILGKRCEHDKT